MFMGSRERARSKGEVEDVGEKRELVVQGPMGNRKGCDSSANVLGGGRDDWWAGGVMCARS